MQRMTIASEEARRAIAHSVMMAPIGSRVKHWTSNQDARSGRTVPCHAERHRKAGQLSRVKLGRGIMEAPDCRCVVGKRMQICLVVALFRP